MLRFPFKGSVSVPQAAAPAPATPLSPFGELWFVVVATPVAGTAQVRYTLPRGFMYQPMVMSFDISTDANVKNRIPEVAGLYVGLSLFWVSLLDRVVTANHGNTIPTTITFSRRVGTTTGTSAPLADLDTHAIHGSLPDVWMRGDDEIIWTLDNAQAGDQMSQIRAVLERWPFIQ